MKHSTKLDAIIVVPKNHERDALAGVLGITLFNPALRLDVDKTSEVFFADIPSVMRSSGAPDRQDIKIGIVILNDETNHVAQAATQEALRKFKPKLAFLVGTAGGLESRCSVGDVIISQNIWDTRKAISNSSGIGFTSQPKQLRASNTLSTDFSKFNSQRADWSEVFILYRKNAEKKFPSVEGLNPNPKIIPNGDIAASDTLHLDTKIIKKISAISPDLCCVEMEAAGFADACLADTNGVQWLVFRGISDLCGNESRSDDNKRVATINATATLFTFIELGLYNTHPKHINVAPSFHKLEGKSPFVEKSAKNHFWPILERKSGVYLSDSEYGRSLNFRDAVTLLMSQGIDKTVAEHHVSEAREEYFASKYLKYDYENNIRTFLGVTWDLEIREILTDAHFNIEEKSILLVGAGNGLELNSVIGQARSIVLVDISRQMLEVAKSKSPKIQTTYCCPAEKMADVGSSFFDAYVSLRTYQSTLFQTAPAVREALRVLKKGGLFLISIANAYVDFVNGSPRVLRGLIEKGTENYVSRSSPRRIAGEVIGKLEALGFVDVKYMCKSSDIYIWATKHE